MAWTSPMTAVANTAFTAAQFNTHVRDNLLETAPAKATTAGGFFVSTGSNAIVERVAQQAVIDTGQTTTSTSYTDLATVGPSVSIQTGSQALVLWGAQIGNIASTSASYRMSVAVSGATTVAASDNWAFGGVQSVGTSARLTGSRSHMFTGLTPGVNTFTAKYRVSSGELMAAFRTIQVIPF